MLYEREGDTKSPLELRFLEDCATVGLLVEPQYPIGMLHADFAIPDAFLVIECDSEQWHSSEESILNDMSRDKIYTEAGWSVFRINGKDIYRGGEEIASFIKHLTQQDRIEEGRVMHISYEENEVVVRG